MQRVILHCDMNNFYASVECMLNPELKNKPVAVCGSVEERHGIVLAKTTQQGVWRFHGRGNLASKAEVPGSCDRGAAL